MNKPLSKQDVERMEPGVLYKTVGANRKQRREFVKFQTSNDKIVVQTIKIKGAKNKIIKHNK